MSVALMPYGAQLPAGASLRSLLIITCGSAWTHATIFGMAEGHCRLLARASAPTTPDNISAGITEAVSAVERITGRQLLSQGRARSPETDTGDGVDGVGIILSVGGPLRLSLVGPGLDVWSGAVRRALATVAVAPTLGAGIDPRAFPVYQTAETEAQVQVPPSAVLVLGPGPGPAGIADPQARGALEDAARQALRFLAAPDQAPRSQAIIAVGGEDEVAVVRRALPGFDVLAGTPQSPTHPGTLPTLLGRLAEELVMMSVPGYANVRTWSSTGSVSGVAALGRFVRFLAQRYTTNVLAVNVGATGTTAIGSSAHGNLFTTHAPLLGLRGGAGAVARRAGAAHLLRWLPNPPPEQDLRTAVLMRMLHPTWLPATPDDLALDGALAREALRLVMEQGAVSGGVGDLARVDVLIGTGGFFAQQPRLGMAALALLDAVQPRGICTLILDSAQLAEPLGAASLLDPMASADAVDVDALLVQLGTCVATVGHPPPGEPAVRVVLEYADGREHVAEVLPGTIETLPLAPGQTARMQLFPTAGVDIGLGPGEHAQAGNPIEGGRLGLIIDARGRPLALPASDQQRQAVLRQWHAALRF